MARSLVGRRAPRAVALAGLIACLAHPSAARAVDATAVPSEPSGGGSGFGASARRAADATFDVIFLRPAGVAVLVVGFGLFVPAVIVGSPGGGKPAIREAWDRFVVPPASYAFARPLGEF